MSSSGAYYSPQETLYRNGHAFRPIHTPRGNPPRIQSSWTSPSSLTIIIALTCIVLFTWLSRIFSKNFTDWHEGAAKIQMRRRNGIPDSDTRPFSIAYKDVVARERKAEQQRVAKLEAAAKEAQARERSNRANGFGVPERPRVSSLSSNRSLADARVHFSQPALPERAAPSPFSSQHREDPKPLPGSLRSPDSMSGRRRPVLAPIDNPAQLDSRKRPADEFDDSTESEEPKRSRLDTFTSDLEENVLSKGAKKRTQSDDTEGFDEPRADKRARQGSGSHREPIDVDMDPASRGLKRSRDLESVAGDESFSSSKPHSQKRRLDDRRPESLQSRGIKRDRSYQGSILGDLEIDSRHSRKRGRHQEASDDSAQLELVEEGDETVSDIEVDEYDDDAQISQDPLCQGRRIGEVWEINNQKFKVGPDGDRLRHALVKKLRKKYDMPKESVHPDAFALIPVYVEEWLTEDQYKSARDKQELAWQDSQSPTEPAPSTLMGLQEGRKPDGKTLLWNAPQPRTPTPTKSSFNLSVGVYTANPFHESPKAPGRRVTYAHPSPLTQPAEARVKQLHHSKSFSKWEKQDIEAAAMTKLREAAKPKALPPPPAPVEEPKPQAAKLPEAPAPPKLPVPSAEPAPAPAPSAATPAVEPSASKPSLAFPANPFLAPSANGTSASTAPKPASNGFAMPTLPAPSTSSFLFQKPEAKPAEAAPSAASASAPAPTPAAPTVPPTAPSSSSSGALAPPAAPAAPQSNPFSFGFTAPKAPASSDSKPSFSFGAPSITPSTSHPAKADAGNAGPVRPTAQPVQSSSFSPSFNFGGPAKPQTASSAPPPSASLPIGSGMTAAASAYSFGQSFGPRDAGTEKKTEEPAEKPAKAPVSIFGQALAQATQKAPEKPAEKPPLTFASFSTTASKSAEPAASQPAATSKPVFGTFGSTSSAFPSNTASSSTLAPASESSKPAVEPEKPKTLPPPSEKPSFSFNFGGSAPAFGTPAKPQETQGNPPSQTLFGQPSASTSNPSSIFGKPGDSTASPFGSTSFNFGAPKENGTAAPAAADASKPAGPAFTFGATSAFGSQAPKPATSIFGAAAGTSPFSFGFSPKPAENGEKKD
ncbi:hypothetical protein SISSUDRAFT_1058095 [Sistotremastrum suecicum HHB10207 ss-3]|uniref:Uncharacterized protein n=1 Tax=Sistotremastrum suecicum HHB10207 ss-3 TaxID=1314776 RepID=A0A166HQ39_9AGAM|nr:hypothetical protein SISSUDRAFT_1058095 [Sistotremastrum suecicum HHB10207 ss-3]